LGPLLAAFTPRRWLLVAVLAICMVALKDERAERALRLVLDMGDPPSPPAVGGSTT
jgi:hypothetical protein